MSELKGRKILVLGASSGIGQAFAMHSAKAGADVLLCGRRADRLAETREMIGTGVTLAVDIANPDDCIRLGEVASQEFGSLDVMLSTVGTAPLRRIEQTSADDWMATMQANVIGLNGAITALLPILTEGALVAALSSEAVAMPRWALAAYGASKAALEASIRAWRLEHPQIRFGVIGVGSTVPTEFARAFDMELLGTALDVWARHGQAQEAFMETDEVGRVLAGIVASLLPFPGINMEHIVLRTPAPVVGSTDLMRKAAFGEEPA